MDTKMEIKELVGDTIRLRSERSWIKSWNQSLNPQNCLLADAFWLLKITTDPYILAHVNRDCPDDKYRKLNLRMSELILKSIDYRTVAYRTMHCML